MIADEDRRGEGRVDALHHAERPRERADDHDWDVRREAIDQERLSVPVRIADHELGGAGFARTLDRGEHLGRHPLTCLSVLEPGRPELLVRRDSGDPLHVGGDVDLEGTLGAGGGGKRGESDDKSG